MNTNAPKSGSVASKEENEFQDPEMKIDTSIFRDHIKQKFKGLVNSLGGENPDSKLIIMDGSLFDVFRHMFTKDEIGAKIRFLSDDIKTDAKHLLVFTPPSVQNMSKLVRIVHNNPEKQIYLIFLPRKRFACIEALKIYGIYGSITSFHDFNFDLIPLDYDLLSLEILDASRQLYLDLDTTSLILIAESIQRLQLVFGKFDTIFGKGYSSRTILETLKSLETESKIRVDETARGEIDALVVLDRNIDFVTPMLTQSTYGGHMDEIWGIKQNNMVQLEKRFFPFSNTLPKDKDIVPHKLQFDRVFREIRDCHVSVVSSILDEKLAEIKTIHDEVAATGGSKDKSLKEMRQKYENERKLREKDYEKVATHVEIRKYIDELMTKPSHFKRIKTEQFIVDGLAKPQDTIDFLETQVLREADLAEVLRLLCLQSLVDAGIKQVALDTTKRNIIQAYGFQHLLTLTNLEKAGLLRRDGEKKTWENLNKQLKLINAEVTLANPEDATFAYEGYCPIMVRLVEQIFKKDGWSAIKNGLDLLQGTTVYEESKINSYTNMQNKHVILVYVVGGITYSELAGMRYLAKKYNKEILVATTGIITGSRLVSSFYENLGQTVTQPTQV